MYCTGGLGLGNLLVARTAGRGGTLAAYVDQQVLAMAWHDAEKGSVWVLWTIE